MAGKDAALLAGNPRSGRMRCSGRMDRWQVRELLCSLGDKGSGAGDLCVSSAACTLRRERSPSSVQASVFTIAACTHTPVFCLETCQVSQRELRRQSDGSQAARKHLSSAHVSRCSSGKLSNRSR